MSDAHGRGRLPGLDSMRGLAALSVVWSHYIMLYGGPPVIGGPLVMDGPLRFWFDGFAAVSLFFVLSGFVLSRKFLAAPDARLISWSGWRRYAALRVLRIWPPYAFVFFVSLALIPLAEVALATVPGKEPGFAGFWLTFPGKRALLAETTLLCPTRSHEVLPQAWSLSVELIVSLAVPLFAYVARRSLAAWLAITAVAFFFDHKVFTFHFLLGVGLARLSWCWDGLRASSAPRAHAARAALVLGGACLYTFRFAWPLAWREIGFAIADPFAITGVGAALLIAAALSSGRAGRALLRPPLLALGRVSYSLYLVHFAVLLAGTNHFLAALNTMAITRRGVAWTLGFAFTTVASIALAAVLERFVERPAVAWGRRVAGASGA